MIHLEEGINMSGCTLTFPSVSVGNVGQLATDLLVAKLKPKKIGMIWHSAIMPLVGGDPYNFSEPALTTSAEVFFSEQCKLIIVQIRSPIIQETSDDFIDELVKWIKESNIIKIVILTGVHDYTSLTSEIGAGALKIVIPSTLSEECDQLERIANDDSSPLNHVSVVRWNTIDKIKMHGGGISRRLFTKCVSNEVSAIVVMKYCSEGDNISDAQLLCVLLNRILRLVDIDCVWKSPPSWSYLYGNSPQPGLY